MYILQNDVSSINVPTLKQTKFPSQFTLLFVSNSTSLIKNHPMLTYQEIGV